MEQAVAAIRAAIDDGRMKPDVRYSVYQLAESLGVSRTPVREALLRLEEVGLIKFEARQGFRIQLPRSTDIADIFAVRLALELPAVRRAASTADPRLTEALRAERALMLDAARTGGEDAFMRHDLRLHDLILDWAGNQRSRSIVRSLRETTRLLGASTADRTRTIADIDREHTPIVDAIIAGRPADAEAAMRGSSGYHGPFAGDPGAARRTAGRTGPIRTRRRHLVGGCRLTGKAAPAIKSNRIHCFGELP